MTTDNYEQAISDCYAETERFGIRMDDTDRLYLQVKNRIEVFRKIFGDDYGIETDFISEGAIGMCRCVIRKADGRIIGTGHSEVRMQSEFAIEAGETKAIGRALASLGLHGGEYASANEMDEVGRQPQRTPARPPQIDRDVPPIRDNDGGVPVDQPSNSGYYLPPLFDGNAVEKDDYDAIVGAMERVIGELDTINDAHEMAAYWAELSNFRTNLSLFDNELFKNLQAAFVDKNRKLTR